MSEVPLASADAGVANQPTRRTEVPAVRFHAVVRFTLENALALELSVMLARVAVEALGLSVKVDSLVALSVTVAAFDKRPTCASAVLAIARARTAAPARA